MDDMNPQAQGRTNDSPQANPATPQQQAQFDLLLGRCRQVMGASAEQWLATLKANPVDGAVTLGTQTLRSIAQMSEKAGQPVDPVVLIHVGIQLVKDIGAVVNEAGLVPDEQLSDWLREVLPRSIATYLRLDAEQGLISPDDKQRAQQMLGGAQGGAPAQEPGPGNVIERMQQGGAT